MDAECITTQTAKNVFSTKGDRERVYLLLILSQIFKFCGEKIIEDLQKYDGVLTLANCFVTNCYNLKFKKIIHTMLPKFSNNYKIACESSLHQAVRNVIDVNTF